MAGGQRMSHGPGKYDHLATLVREKAQARGVILIVVDGDQGMGFSVQTSDFEVLALLPAILRSTADLIDADFSEA